MFRTCPRILLIPVFLLLTHCASATPVTAAPLSPEQQPQLEAALLGTCEVTGTQSKGGTIKEAKGVHMTFAPGGKLRYQIQAMGTITRDATYRVEGRNVFTDGIYKAMRVDEFQPDLLKLFMYELTETYYCTKKRAT